MLKNKILLRQEILQVVNQVKYLDPTIQKTVNCFRIYIKQIKTGATKAIHDIRELTKLFLKTARTIVDATYV